MQIMHTSYLSMHTSYPDSVNFSTTLKFSLPQVK